MNSLSDLNTLSSQGISFSDSRTKQVTFDRTTAQNQLASIVGTDPYTLVPGINLTKLINAEDEFFANNIVDGGTRTVSGLIYSINMNVSGSVTTDPDQAEAQAQALANYVTFAGVTTGFTGYTPLTGIGSGNMWVVWSVNNSPSYTLLNFSIYGIRSVGDWQLVKSPVINKTVGSLSVNLFQSTLQGTNFSKTWYTTVNPSVTDELGTAGDAYYYSYNYYGGTHLTTIANVPLVTASSNANLVTSNYTCTVTASDVAALGNLSTGGAGGSSVWDSTNYKLTINGNAAQVNSRLGNLIYVPAQNYSGTFKLNYSLYNPVTTYTYTADQYVKNQDDTKFTEPGIDYYDDSTVTVLTSGPSIVYANVAGPYTVTVTATPSTAVYSITTNGSGGTSVWSANTKTLTMTGTRAQVNSHLSSINFEPVDDYTSSVTLNYTVLVDTISFGQTQSLIYKDTNPLVSNTTVSRDYATNGYVQPHLFKFQQPQILEDAVGDPTYTVTLSSTAGRFSTDNVTVQTPFVFSGNVSTVNLNFFNVLFYPNKDVTGTQTFNMQILRDSTQILNQTVPLTNTGLDTTYNLTAGNLIFTSSQTYTPDLARMLYQKYDIMLVGGGAGGGRAPSMISGAGGGGGAGEVIGVTNITLPIGALNITIGSGGAGATTLSGDGAIGGNTSIGGTINYIAEGGRGGGGTSNFRSGGNVGSGGNSVGTAAGGSWRHTGGAGGAGAGAYGGGGGGAMTSGSAGGGEESGFGGDPLLPANFSLVTNVPGAVKEVSPGGAGMGHGNAVRYGGGGGGGDGNYAGGDGYQGIVILRFY